MLTMKIKPSSPEQGEYVLINAVDFDPAVHERAEGEETVVPGKYDDLNRSALEELALRRFKASMAQFSDEDLREAFEHDDHLSAERASRDAEAEAELQAERDAAAAKHEEAIKAAEAAAAPPEPVTASADAGPPSALDDMKLDELLKHAVDNKVDLAGAKKKADVLRVLKAAEAAAAAPERAADDLDRLSDEALVEQAVDIGVPVVGGESREDLLAAVKAKRDELASGAEAEA